MSEQLIEKPFKELVDSVSSKSAAPGGGSIAAAAGALGAGLVVMSCRFTIGNEKYQAQWDEFQKIIDEVEKYRIQLLELVDKDSEAYNGIVEVYKAKKKIIAEQGEQDFQYKLQLAYKHAAEVPLNTAESSLEVLKRSKTVAENGNVNTITDTGVGAQMAFTGVIGAILNVEINLKSIEDENYKQMVFEQTKMLKDSAIKLLEEIMNVVNSQM
jgi:formiminotetrahydrofolate cyclodeaminase